MRSGTEARLVQVLEAGSYLANWLMVPPAEKEYPPATYREVPSLATPAP